MTPPRRAFLGTGCLGATYAVCFVPFHEPGLDDLLRHNLAGWAYRARATVGVTLSPALRPCF